MFCHHECTMQENIALGKFYDQGDAKWIITKGQLRGHNDTPCLSAGQGLATYRVYLVVSITIN
jgi:hypothetical protein